MGNSLRGDRVTADRGGWLIVKALDEHLASVES